MSALPERPQLLKPDDYKKAETALRVLEMIAAQEMHFNKLCADFKKMASTWLLATFGGIGFLLSTDLKIGIDKFFLIGAVAGAGAIGIYLLWIVDLLVYQRLLSSAFAWRGRIEAENRWLPPIFETMRQRIYAEAVGFNLVWFYIGGVSVPAAVSVGFFARASIAPIGSTGVVIGVVVVSLLLISVLIRMYYVSIPLERVGRLIRP